MRLVRWVASCIETLRIMADRDTMTAIHDAERED